MIMLSKELFDRKYCKYCYAPLKDSSTCGYCYAGNCAYSLGEFFIKEDSPNTFKCFSCDNKVSVDVMFVEDNNHRVCQKCGNNLNFCPECDGRGYLDSTKFAYRRKLLKMPVMLLYIVAITGLFAALINPAVAGSGVGFVAGIITYYWLRPDREEFRVKCQSCKHGVN